MENDTNNVNQENIPEVFSSNPQTGNEPVEAVDSEQLVNMGVDVNKTVEVNTQVENVVEPQVIPETGVEPVNVEPTETVIPVEPVVETQVIPETGSEPVSVEPTEAVTPVEPVVETQVIPETGVEPVNVEPTETVTPVEPVVETQVIPETGSEPVNVQPVESNKKSNKGLVTIIVIILLVLVGVGIYFFLNKDNKDKEQSGDKSNSNVTSNDEQIGSACSNGKYYNGNDIMYVFCKKEKNIVSGKIEKVVDFNIDYDEYDFYDDRTLGEIAYFVTDNIALEDSYAASYQRNKDTLNHTEMMDFYLEFKDNKIILIDKKRKTEYEKKEDYTKEEYFIDEYNGEASLFDGKLNAVYKKDNKVIIIYPSNDDKLMFYYFEPKTKNGELGLNLNVVSGYISSSTDEIDEMGAILNKTNDNIYSYETKLFSNEVLIEINVAENNIVLKYKNSEKDTSNIEGTYTKIKSISVDDILNSNFE